MNNQITRRADLMIPTVCSHLEQDEEIRLFSLALRWPHSSLRVSICMALDISSEECLHVNDLRASSCEAALGPFRKSKCFRHELV